MRGVAPVRLRIARSATGRPGTEAYIEEKTRHDRQGRCESKWGYFVNRTSTSFSHSVCDMSRLFGVGDEKQMIEVAIGYAVGVAFISVAPIFPLGRNH